MDERLQILAGKSIDPPSRSSWANPTTAVSGVRNSWLTPATNSSLVRTSSSNCSVARFRSVTSLAHPDNACDAAFLPDRREPGVEATIRDLDRSRETTPRPAPAALQ